MDIPVEKKPRRGLIRWVKPLLMMLTGYLLFIFGALLQPIGAFGFFLAIWGLVKFIKVF